MMRGTIAFLCVIAICGCGESIESRQQREQIILAEARQLMASEKYADAKSQLAKISSGPEVDSLMKEIDAGERRQNQARQIQETLTRAASIKENLGRLDVTDVSSMAGVRLAFSEFESADAFLILTKDQELSQEAQNLRQQIRTTLAAKRVLLLPRMRMTYAKDLALSLWENDVEVVSSGPGNRKIRFIGGMFAANRNIASAQQTASPMLRKLGFTRAQYEWYRGSEYTYYDIKSEPDGRVPE